MISDKELSTIVLMLLVFIFGVVLINHLLARFYIGTTTNSNQGNASPNNAYPYIGGSDIELAVFQYQEGERWGVIDGANDAQNGVRSDASTNYIKDASAEWKRGYADGYERSWQESQKRTTIRHFLFSQN
jgi:hypothetical protein